MIRVFKDELTTEGRYDCVCVELYIWTDSAYTDTIILHTFISVDGEPQVDDKQILRGMTEAEMIRLAIEEFDKALIAHPSRANLDSLRSAAYKKRMQRYK